MTTYKIEIQELLSRIIEIEAPPLPRLHRGQWFSVCNAEYKR